MTELEWYWTDKPHALIDLAGAHLTPRKLCLLACGMCRLNWSAIRSPEDRANVERLEAWASFPAPDPKPPRLEPDGLGLEAFLQVLPLSQLMTFSLRMARLAVMHAPILEGGIHANQLRLHADLIRDSIGNPFDPFIVDPEWLLWENETIPKMARVIHAEQRWEDLPILADALEEAGCESQTVLCHCREENLHARGCYVIDSLLGRHEPAPISIG